MNDIRHQYSSHVISVHTAAVEASTHSYAAYFKVVGEHSHLSAVLDSDAPRKNAIGQRIQGLQEHGTCSGKYEAFDTAAEAQVWCEARIREAVAILIAARDTAYARVMAERAATEALSRIEL